MTTSQASSSHDVDNPKRALLCIYTLQESHNSPVVPGAVSALISIKQHLCAADGGASWRSCVAASHGARVMPELALPVIAFQQPKPASRPRFSDQGARAVLRPHPFRWLPRWWPWRSCLAGNFSRMSSGPALARPWWPLPIMARLAAASRRGGPSVVNLHHVNVHVGVSCLHEWTSVTHFESSWTLLRPVWTLVRPEQRLAGWHTFWVRGPGWHRRTSLRTVGAFYSVFLTAVYGGIMERTLQETHAFVPVHNPHLCCVLNRYKASGTNVVEHLYRARYPVQIPHICTGWSLGMIQMCLPPPTWQGGICTG
jgi:hypothetical protein